MTDCVSIVHVKEMQCVPIGCFSMSKGPEVRDFTENNTGVKSGWAGRPDRSGPYSANTVY